MSEPSLPVGKELFHYRILSRLGAGGMGEVYLAQDTRLGRQVALKILPADVAADPQRMQRFIQEARATSALNHPHILTLYEIGETEGLHFLAAEFIDGEILRNHFLSVHLKLTDVLDIALQIASALTAAHQAGIIHRDLKPENIMVRRDGYVKVLDFGLAKVTTAIFESEASTAIQVQTSPGTVMGTANYMSPEQVRGFEVDARSDIWSLGVVVYELVTGRFPFSGETSSDVMAAILMKEPLPIAHYMPEAPVELERILSKALTKDQEERYQSAKELQIDLKRLKQRIEIEAELERSQELEISKILSRKSSGPLSPELTKDSRGTGPLGTPPATRRRSRKAIDSLAVLPLVNACPDPNMEYLSDGITESLIKNFSQVPKLRVMARSTVFRYKGKNVDPQEVGQQLNVRAVLTGRVVHRDDRLIIKMELVDVLDGAHLWGEQYSRAFPDIFAIEEEIANEISEKLRLKLSGEEKKRLTKRYTENTEAYQLYLKGRYFCNKRTKTWLKKSIECFLEAIDTDPNYALAYAGLADAYALLGSATGGHSPCETYPRAKAAALKALEIDPTLAEAYTSLGFFNLLYDWDWSAAERVFRRAIQLNPGYASAHDGYGFFFKVTGQCDAAVTECKCAQKLDPLSPFINISLAWAYYFARRFDEAIQHNQKVLELDPQFSFAYWNLGLAYEQKKLYQDALKSFQKAVELSGDELTFLAHLGHANALMGNQEEARNILETFQNLSSQRYVSSYYSAIIHLGLNDHEQAFEWLEKALAERSGFLAFLKVEPLFDPLRSDPRFKNLLQRIGLV